MNFRWVSAAMLGVPLLAACGSQAAGSEDAMFACASAFALDQTIQAVRAGQEPNPEAAQVLMGSMQVSAEDAANANPDFQQLAFLVSGFVMAIEQGNEEAVLDLVAIEGECEQLGFGIN